jgi:hypothetical protein
VKEELVSPDANKMTGGCIYSGLYLKCWLFG